MRRVGIIGAASATLSLAVSGAIRSIAPIGPGVNDPWRRLSKEGARNGRLIPAGINRHTGKPHEHRREIARRLRQQGSGSW